ncbi:arginine--tRNA ligase [Candidatus Peregrinibacteria bacterium]|nr:arginine--tRNA ligase [Candidatus Peregrinibacteria bacterium]
MKLIVEKEIFNNYPNLKLGLIVIRGLDNTRRNSNIESLLRGIGAQRAKEFADKELDNEPKIKTWYDAYGRFGVNPKKYPPSIAALVKRLKDGKEIPHISALVDLYNYYSLKFMMPIGGEDLDWLCGDLRLTYTKGGEPFRPLGTIDVQNAKEGEVAYLDEGGITCRYWNHRECERTKFTEKTKNAVIIVEDLNNMHLDQFGGMLKEIQQGIIKYLGGQIEPYVLIEEKNSVDFGIQGRKNADDSKIPQQEKAYYKTHVGVEAPKQTETKETPKQKSPKKPESETKIFIVDKSAINSQLKEILQKAVQKAFPQTKIDLSIEYPLSKDHGDYASNIAMRLAKELQKSPQKVAQNIIENIGENDLLKKVEIAGPGFINFHLSEKTLNKEIEKILTQKESYGKIPEDLSTRTVIVEYSQPNIAKPLGVHHLLSTIIGQSIYNIYKFLGFNAISINHIGDWGTQFGKLIYAYKTWGDKKTVEKDPIAQLLKLYVRFHDEAEKNPELEDKARHEFKIFEDGDKENHELWQWFVDESMKEINKTYDLLGGIHFDYTTGESFYEDKMPAILEEGKEKGIIVEGEEGAYVINFDDPNIPTVPVQKKDGATLYITRDFATLKYRLEHFKPEKIIYVVDTAQTLHFKQIFAAAKKFGWDYTKAVHVSFGRMQMKDAKMSTRKGNIVLLDDVINEGIKKATEIIREKSPDLKEKDKVAKAVGIGAIKYNVLHQNRTTDITFDWDKMLAIEGNSAPYLQYTYARCRSILRKADEKQQSNDAVGKNLKPEEEKLIQSLIVLFPKFKEQLIISAQEYKPNLLSNYLFELAQKFNSFYNSIPVLKANPKDREKLLKIVEATSQILRNGLTLLGVEVIEEM